MASVRWLCIVGILLGAFSHTHQAPPNLAGPEYVFELKNGDKTCFYASFQLEFMIAYAHYPNASNTSVVDIMSKDIHLPNNTQVNVSGECGSGKTFLQLTWEADGTVYNSTLEFTLTNFTWFASFISFSFDPAAFMNAVDTPPQTYVTNETDLFTRSFSRQEFFYCEKCKTFLFANCSEDSVVNGECVNPCPLNQKNVSQCNSSLNMMSSVLYPGDIAVTNPGRKLCMEDYIALQELIVPIVVGGILAILLVLIFVSYIIAYIRRRRREGRYDRLETTY